MAIRRVEPKRSRTDEIVMGIQYMRDPEKLGRVLGAVVIQIADVAGKYQALAVLDMTYELIKKRPDDAPA